MENQNNVLYVKDKRIAPYLLACSFIGLVKFAGKVTDGKVLYWMFTPKSTADELSTQFFIKSEPKISVRDLFEAQDTWLDDVRSFKSFSAIQTNNQISTGLIEKPQETESRRLPLEKQLPVHKYSYLIEDLLNTKIANWGKQAKATKMLQKAGYKDEDIIKAIKYMANDDFYSTKGFDIMTVVNSIDKVMVRMKEENSKKDWMYTK
jgi:hypothetical protein